jgi:hypothetical protein
MEHILWRPLSRSFSTDVCVQPSKLKLDNIPLEVVFAYVRAQAEALLVWRLGEDDLVKLLGLSVKKTQ